MGKEKTYKKEHIESVFNLLGYSSNDLVLLFKDEDVSVSELNAALKKLGIKVKTDKFLADVDVESVYMVSKLLNKTQGKLKRNIGIKNEVTIVEQISETIYEEPAIHRKNVKAQSFEEEESIEIIEVMEVSVEKEVDIQKVMEPKKEIKIDETKLKEYISIELSNIDRVEKEELVRIKTNEENLSKSELRREIQSLQQKMRLKRLMLQSSSVRKELAAKYNLGSY